MKVIGIRVKIELLAAMEAQDAKLKAASEGRGMMDDGKRVAEIRVLTSEL